VLKSTTVIVSFSFWLDNLVSVTRLMRFSGACICQMVAERVE